MTEGTPRKKHDLVRETLVSLWHTGFRYDWRALCVVDDAIHLVYLGKPNPLWLLVGPIAGIVLQVQARKAYKRATAVPVEQRLDSHSKNITLHRSDVANIEGSGRKISITTNEGATFKLIRMGDGDLMGMTDGFQPC